MFLDSIAHRAEVTVATPLGHPVIEVVLVTLTDCVMGGVAHPSDVGILGTYGTGFAHLGVAEVWAEALSIHTAHALGVVGGCAGGLDAPTRGALGTATLAIQAVLIGSTLPLVIPTLHLQDKSSVISFQIHQFG